ncbi:MAG: GNAT family N-acetyltransferase [Pirellulales bacterium]
MLALSHWPPLDRPRHLAAWADAIGHNHAALWIGCRGPRVVAAMLAEVQPGRTAVVGCPRVAEGEPSETAITVLTHVCDELRQSDIRLAQSLTLKHLPRDGAVLLAAGFEASCDLLYLVSLSGTFPSAPPDNDLEWIPYETAGHDRLRSMIEQTYEGSLDCAKFQHRRSLDDVLAGYRAVGTLDGARWLIARQRGVDVGCLLLADHPDSNAWELVYMGVIPGARGRGLGVALARQAQWLAAFAGRERLSVAVDADNGPAISAYAAAGFTGWDRRTVYLRAFA